MLESVVSWLDQLSSQVFWTSAMALVAIDLVAVAAVMQTRSRALVNRWTGPVLAANLLLLGAGTGRAGGGVRRQGRGERRGTLRGRLHCNGVQGRPARPSAGADRAGVPPAACRVPDEDGLGTG